MNRDVMDFIVNILGVPDPVCFNSGNRCVLITGGERLDLILIEHSDDQITAHYTRDHHMLDDIDVVRRAFELIEDMTA